LLPQGAQHLARIEQSHQRCAALGLSRIGRPEHAPLPRADLGQVLERHRRLFQHAAPVMELLHEQIVDTHSMVVLCDATGTIIHSIGDPDFLARASQVALQPGVNWSEPAKGTNAIGTALMDEAPTLVHAQEHFMHANHFLTCSAVPIFDPRGDVLGVLDVTGDHRSYHPHTMALVNMSARMIENHWLSDDLDHQLCLHLHPRAECLGTLLDGILVATPEGRIVGANRSALALLQLGAAAVRTHSLGSLLGSSAAALVAHFRRAAAPPLRLQLPDGRALYARARFGWQTWRRAGGVEASVDVPACPPQQPTQTAPDASAGTMSLKALEIATIRRTVDALGGNISAASQRLGISRNTIYRRLRQADPG
jgi:transcriptional regulator of acetoin/glycerol metabolism